MGLRIRTQRQFDDDLLLLCELCFDGVPLPQVRVALNGPTNLYGIDEFTYVPAENCYICPEGKPLKYVGINPLNRTHLYYSTIKCCRECSQKSRCTRGKYRALAIHTCEAAQQRAHALAKTPAFAISQRLVET